jgi:hypothetical protein
MDKIIKEGGNIMSVKKTVETTSQKILNSDIYDITRFVDNIKKQNIDGVENSETLMVGMYGYLGYQFSSLLQNAIVTASELSNEAIPTRAKFDRNVITHALSLGVEKVAATPANMKILLMFPEKALQANMIDGEFTFTADTPLTFDEFEFHTDYDITIKYTDLTDSTNGSQRNYVYTATYNMDRTNSISDIDNPFLPPVVVFNYEEDNMIALCTNIHQVYYKEIYEKILDSDVIANKTISFSFDKQMSHFNIIVEEPSTDTAGEGNTVYLNAVYDGLYNQEIAGQKYCYYQYINSNTIRIRFDPSNYQPPANSDLTIECYTTDGASGNFEYSEEKTIRLTSDRYTNLYCIIAQRGDDGSSGGLDRQTIEELQHIIPKEALSRGSITTLTDLRNFFNSLNNENSVLHVFRKEDNILDRVYYVYNLMKDAENNIVPTNTIPIYIESTRRDNNNGKIYIESGTPVFYYKFGEGADLPILRDNYVGYLQQKVANVDTNYSFYDGNGYTTFQGIPTDESLDEWYINYNTSFDPDKEIEGFSYKVAKPSNSYDFHENGSIYFKPYYSTNIAHRQPDIEELYDKWYYGTCRSCELKKLSVNIGFLNSIIYKMFVGKKLDEDIFDIEITWTESSNGITTTVHFPMENPGDINPEKKEFETGNNYYVNITRDADKKIKSISLNTDKQKYITSVKFYRPRMFDSSGTVVGKTNSCVVEIPLKHDDNGNLTLTFYAWLLRLSFYDESTKFSIAPITIDPSAVSRTFFVPDYLVDLSSLDTENKKLYAETYYNTIMTPYIDGMGEFLILDSINTIDVYSYDGQGDYGFDSLTLAEGDLIRFSTYLEGESTADFIYKDPSTWTLGEVLSIEKLDGRIVSIEVLVQNNELGQFENYRYNLPLRIYNEYDKQTLDSTYIVLIAKITKFLYTNPLSIVLKDDPTINTHRITASYYLDIIDETRYQQFDCINSKSPIQFIMPSIKTVRSSYLSDNRYRYDIKLNIKPNTGTVDANMINRTQIIGVLYKKDADDSTVSRPIMYTIAKYTGGDDLENVNDEDGIPYEFNLYTRPFTTSSKEDADKGCADIIDDNNDVYIGPKRFIEEIAEAIGGENPLETEEAKRIFWENYRCFNVTANTSEDRPVDFNPNKIDLNNISNCSNNSKTPAQGFYADTIYLNLNTELKIYILYKYDIMSTKTYTDSLTANYLTINSRNVDALYNSVPQSTVFTQPIVVTDDDDAYVPDYTLKQMVLTNVYSTYEGINLLHDYSNIMNSYVTSIKTNDIFNLDNDKIESYIVNRVPCLRYFYWWSEDRVLTFIKEMKKKINYVLDAIAPLECTFGLDYKFFNTYGPSQMYHLTDDDGDVTSEYIDNVALTMTFRAKFYNEDSDAWSLKDNIKDTIKDYLEDLDQLDDIHFPNITTMIETEYAEYLIYFEYVSFNIYDAVNQHIVSVEDMEMLSMVPEFLHVDTNDLTGLPYINIRIVTT